MSGVDAIARGPAWDAPVRGGLAAGLLDARVQPEVADELLGRGEPGEVADSNRVPTPLSRNASGKRAARACVAFQPVQCAGTRKSGASSANASQVGLMSGSKRGPFTWKPPMTAWIRLLRVNLLT